MLYLLSSEEQKYLIADYKRSKLSFLSSGEEIINLCRRTKAKGVIFILYYPEYLEFDIRYLDAKNGPTHVDDEILTCAARYVFANNNEQNRNVVRIWVWNTLRRIEVPEDDKISFRLWENFPEFLPPVNNATDICQMLPETMEEWMGLWFDVFNTEYFDGKLPMPEFVAKDRLGALGKYDHVKQRILLEYYGKAPFLMGKAEREDYQATLIHEMIHEYQYINGLLKGEGHGDAFFEKATEIDRKGGWRIVETEISHQHLPRWTQSCEQYWWITRQNSFPEYIVYQSDADGTISKEMENDRGRIFVGNGVLYKVNTLYRPDLWGKYKFRKFILPILKEGTRLSERDPMYPELP